MFNGFRIGDRVRLRNDMGLIKRGSVGLVVEEYEPITPRQPLAGKEDFEVAVVWPMLRHENPLEAGVGPWLPDGLDVDNLHEGDVVPMHSKGLEFVDNLLAVG